jgi:hypothetical protein
MWRIRRCFDDTSYWEKLNTIDASERFENEEEE